MPSCPSSLPCGDLSPSAIWNDGTSCVRDMPPEPGCWLWGGCRSPEEERNAGSHFHLCSASQWRGSPFNRPTWTILVNSQCLFASPLLPSSWVTSHLHLYFTSHVGSWKGCGWLKLPGAGPLSPQLCHLLRAKSSLNSDGPALSSARSGES